MKFNVHNISSIYTSATTSSVSVELFVFSVIFLEQIDVDSFPIMNIAPPCSLQSLWTSCDPSTYHFSSPRSPTLSLSFKCLVPFRYLSTHLSFPQSPLSGDFTLAVRNTTVICMSYLAGVDMNNSWTTVQWKASALSLSSSCASCSSLMVNRSSAPGVAFLPTISFGNDDIMFFRYVIIDTSIAP